MSQKILTALLVLALLVTGCAPIVDTSVDAAPDTLATPAPDTAPDEPGDEPVDAAADAAPAAPVGPLAPTVGPSPQADLDEVADVYEDPDGRFSVPIPAGWTAETLDEYGLLTSPDGDLLVYVLTLEADDLETALDEVWELIGPELELTVVQTQAPPSTGEIEETLIKVYESDEPDQIYYAIAELHEGVAYFTILDSDMEGLQRRGSQFNVIASGFTIAAIEPETLGDVEPLPFSDEMRAALEAYIIDAMERFDTPGVAVAIVQNGEIVFAEGFGIRNPETEDPVDADTLMMIGSTTKTFTTMLMAALIDEGRMAWDTPVVELLPPFAVADPELTPQITVEHLVCNCTGVSRRDLELLFNAGDLSAEDIVESLATFEFFTDFGEAFQYSNQMIATGGYAAAAAASGEYGNLYDAFDQALHEYILDPIGMSRSTLRFDEVTADDNYAVPFGLDLSFTYTPIPLSDENFVTPVAPAGALWSSASEMGRYLQTLLDAGETPDGERVVSTENLMATWEPQVPVAANVSYGLGWFVGDYRDQPMLFHGGATIGFTSDLAFLPEADLGISVLTNARASLLNEAIRYRILEMIFDQEPESDAQFSFMFETFQEQYAEEAARTVELDPEAVEPYLGDYFNQALGAATLELENGTLLMDADEFRADIRPQADEDGEITNYITFDAPAMTGLPVFLDEDDAGEPIIIFGTGAFSYIFERVE